MQTVEQRIEKLDKRIDLFENYLQTQVIALNIKHRKCSIMGKLSWLYAMDRNIKQFFILASKPLPKYPKGGRFC